MAVMGQWLSSQAVIVNQQTLYVALTVGLAMAFTNVHNDLLDVAVDQVNRPDRPLPRGAVLRGEATWLAIILATGSLLAAYYAGGQLWQLTLLVLGCAGLYNLWLKRIPILGNLLVATICGLSLAAAHWAITGSKFPLFPLLIAVAFILAREFINTIADDLGDRLSGRRSIYSLWGKRAVLKISLALTGLACVLAYWPALTLPSPAWQYYLVTVTLTSILPSGLAIYAISRDSSAANIARISSHLRYVFFSTFLAFLWLV